MGLITLSISSKTNQPPSSSGWLSLQLSYNQTYVFTLANFTTETTPPYADPDGDALESIRITSIPTQGVLNLVATPVVVNDIITSAQLTNGDLNYVSDGADVDGYSNSELEFLVSDVGSSTFNLSPNIVTFVVAGNINLPPSEVGDGVLDITVGTVVVFTRTMLTSSLNPPYVDPEGNPAENLLIETVPSFGTITLNGVLVVDGQVVSFTDIDSGLLVYTNTSLTVGGALEEFTFKISDTGSGEYTG
jgi:hypothetical protein